jgi:hypothetical protein
MPLIGHISYLARDFEDILVKWRAYVRPRRTLNLMPTACRRLNVLHPSFYATVSGLPKQHESEEAK